MIPHSHSRMSSVEWLAFMISYVHHTHCLASKIWSQQEILLQPYAIFGYLTLIATLHNRASNTIACQTRTHQRRDRVLRLPPRLEMLPDALTGALPFPLLGAMSDVPADEELRSLTRNGRVARDARHRPTVLFSRSDFLKCANSKRYNHQSFCCSSPSRSVHCTCERRGCSKWAGRRRVKEERPTLDPCSSHKVTRPRILGCGGEAQ